MLNILTVSHSLPHSLRASKKEENKGLMLSITEISVQILEENLIQTNSVAIFEIVTWCFPVQSRIVLCTIVQLKHQTETALPFVQPPHFQLEHVLFSFIALHPHSRAFSGKARRNEMPPWCFHPCSMIFVLISSVYFTYKAFDCSPQKALMLLI